MDKRHFGFELKESNMSEGKGLFEGVLAAFSVDNVNDQFLPGAFKKTLSESGKRIKLLWQHNWTEPIGIMTGKETQKGLEVKGDLNLMLDSHGNQMVPNAHKAFALLSRGDISELSIGFLPVKTAFEKRRGEEIRLLKEVRVMEGSIVTFPANKDAIVTDIKSYNDIYTYILEHKHDDAFIEKIHSLLCTYEPEKTTQKAIIEPGNLELMLLMEKMINTIKEEK